MIGHKRTDRRIERTRTLLRDALMAIVVERPWESITVQDITDRANVNRATFYLHFRDKDELLLQSMTALYAELLGQQGHVDRQQVLNSGGESLFDDPSDFEHVAQHADFYRAMLSSRGSAAFIVGVMDYLTQMYQSEVVQPLAGDSVPKTPPGFTAAFLAGAEIGVMRWWLQQQHHFSPDEMAKLMYQLSSRGMNWALNLAPLANPDDASPSAK
jgi:AcrR family transcriptional regulator